MSPPTGSSASGVVAVERPHSTPGPEGRVRTSRRMSAKKLAQDKHPPVRAAHDAMFFVNTVRRTCHLPLGAGVAGPLSGVSLSRPSRGLGPEDSSAGFSGFFPCEGLRDDFAGGLLLTAGTGFGFGSGSSTEAFSPSVGISAASDKSSPWGCPPERPNQSQPPTSSGRTSRSTLASQTNSGSPAYRRDSNGPRGAAGLAVP